MLRNLFSNLTKIENWTRKNITRSTIVLMLCIEGFFAVVQLADPSPELPLLAFSLMYATIGFTIWLYRLDKKGSRLPAYLLPIVPNIISLFSYYVNLVYNPTNIFLLLIPLIGIIVTAGLSGFTINVRTQLIIFVSDLVIVLVGHMYFTDVFESPNPIRSLSTVIWIAISAVICVLAVANWEGLVRRLATLEHIAEMEDRLKRVTASLEAATREINELMTMNMSIEQKRQELAIIIDNLATQIHKNDLSIVSGVVENAPRTFGDELSFTIKKYTGSPIWIRCCAENKITAGEEIIVLGTVESEQNRKSRKHTAYVWAVTIIKM